jgi:hypothetical protein
LFYRLRLAQQAKQKNKSMAVKQKQDEAAFAERSKPEAIKRRQLRLFSI